ncbi:MAG: histidine kinase dimerization/phospho-acceptor domain-containing protein [Acidimicrobiales bacterium]
MSVSSDQLQFAAEFVLFLAAASGLALVALCGAQLNDKADGELALTVGFLALAASAFMHGSQLVGGGGSVIVGLRTAGLVGVLVGCLRGWVAGEAARIPLGVAAGFVAAAMFLDGGNGAVSRTATYSRVALAVGGLTLGAAVLVASRRSIAARVAATAATTLLIVVLVLGVATSAVLVSSMQGSALNSLARRAATLSELDTTALEQIAMSDRDVAVVRTTRDTVTDRWPGRESDQSIADIVESDLKSPQQASSNSIAGMVRRALDDCPGIDNCTIAGVVGNRFFAVALTPSSTPQLALVVSTPTELMVRARNDLFRNLFLVALVGALLALVFAAIVGANIGAGLRRLRAAVDAIQQGDLAVRSGIESSDEVGMLSRAFDSMASSVQDKTAAEARMRYRLEAVVAGMGEALVAVDRKGRITDFNRAAARLLGVPQPEAVGQRVGDVVRVCGEDGVSIPMAPSESSTAWSNFGLIETTDGRQVPVTVSVGALRGPGTDAGGSVIVFADLTREREVDQMKKQFLSRVGHELRHPLVPLLGYAEILNRKDVAPPQARAMHAEMIDQVRKMLRIVEMLEFFAAAGAGQISPEPGGGRSEVDRRRGRGAMAGAAGLVARRPTSGRSGHSDRAD